MKAIVYHQYGSPDVLRCEDIDRPAPADDEVLIRVRAASVNPADRHFMRGPYLARIAMGLRRPRITRLGLDFAGHVELVGSKVTQIRPGDEVLGASRGAFAEYVCARENRLARKPAHITFEQGAAIPVAGLTALQALRDKGRIQAGQRVLINGASGGVGTFAVQIAKSFGATVTAVCSTRNLDLVRSLGADHVIDYTRDDFTKGVRAYHLILDCVGNHSLSERRRVLLPGGVYVGAGVLSGQMIRGLARGVMGLALSRFSSQRFVMLLASIKSADLAVLCQLIEAGKVTPVIDRRYTLSHVPDAIRYLEEGHARGKVAILF